MRLKKYFIIFCILPFLAGCGHTPPDVLGCTPYPAMDWPELRDNYFKLCGADFMCNQKMDHWKKVVPTWASPTDSGTCVTWMSQKVYDVDADHPLPKELSATHKPRPWKDIAEEGITLPARESAAPIKTFVQSFCHDEGQCGDAGKWQGTLNKTDAALVTQKGKVELQRRNDEKKSN